MGKDFNAWSTQKKGMDSTEQLLHVQKGKRS